MFVVAPRLVLGCSELQELVHSLEPLELVEHWCKWNGGVGGVIWCWVGWRNWRWWVGISVLILPLCSLTISLQLHFTGLILEQLQESGRVGSVGELVILVPPHRPKSRCS